MTFGPITTRLSSNMCCCFFKWFKKKKKMSGVKVRCVFLGGLPEIYIYIYTFNLDARLKYVCIDPLLINTTIFGRLIRANVRRPSYKRYSQKLEHFIYVWRLQVLWVTRPIQERLYQYWIDSSPLESKYTLVWREGSVGGRGGGYKRNNVVLDVTLRVWFHVFIREQNTFR